MGGIAKVQLSVICTSPSIAVEVATAAATDSAVGVRGSRGRGARFGAPGVEVALAVPGLAALCQILRIVLERDKNRRLVIEREADGTRVLLEGMAIDEMEGLLARIFEKRPDESPG